MANPEDYICVNGNFLAYSYHSNTALTAGIIEVKGDFTQKYSYGYSDNFAPSGDHKVILSGKNVQKVNFVSEKSKFNILEITKPLGTGYVFSRTPLWNELIEEKTDTEAPTAPQNLKFIRSNSSSIAIAWNASSDNSAVYCYYIYRDGDQIGSTAKTEYIDNGLSSSTSYEYYVVACDTAGNLSERSNILEAATDVDEYAPTQPKNLSAKILSDGIVRLSWTASSDNGSVEKYNVYRNGVLIGTSTGTAYTDSAAVGGYYEYYVEAVDNEGNVSRASESAYIDNLAPTAPILTLNSVHENSIFLSWESTDNVKVTKYELYRNGEKYKSLDGSTFVDLSVEDDKTYTYYVVAFDAFSNASEKSNEVTVYTGEDTEVPIISEIVSSPISDMKNTVIKVSAKDNCGVSKVYVQYSEDKAVWRNCASADAAERAFAAVYVKIYTGDMNDGTIYFRAYAEDINGNKGNADESPVFSITVDNTAPDAPANVKCSSENDIIELTWSGVSDDIAYYRIYRKTSDNEYLLLKDKYKYVNYYESDIVLGEIYSYKVTAVDNAGNESNFSTEVSGCISEDSVKPRVICISPESGSNIGENPTIYVSCYDNFKLKDIKVQCRKSDSAQWEDLYFVETDKYAEIVEFSLNTADFMDGYYQIKAVLTDSALNQSDEYIAEYNYRKCTLSSPKLSADGAGWSVNLSWSMTNTDEIAGYYVYRRGTSESEYSLIASTAENGMIDYNVKAGQKYYYYVEAVDFRGNTVRGETVFAIPTDEDTVAPIAYIGEGLFGIAGRSVNFDGTGSRDNHMVSAYEWDFGDGTTSSVSKPEHTYSSEGTYDISLTVYDSAGNSDTAETQIIIYDKSFDCVKIKVRGSDRGYISGARIYCEETDKKIDANTDSFGSYDFVAKPGSYDVYVYFEGYIPKMVTVNVNGEASVIDVVLSKGEVAVGKLTTRPLELNEILALGIDPEDPKNQNVYVHNVELRCDNQRKELELITSSSGKLIKINETHNKNWTVYAEPVVIHGKTSAIVLFSIYTEISWLKEFYEVELTIINKADENFTLENCTADLDLPSGLTLAKTDRGESKYLEFGRVRGGEQKSVSWIVRGDQKGEYYMTADFNCVLTPFMENISLKFKNEDPLIVYGGDALQLDIDYSEFDPNNDYWTAKFTLTNISDKPVYNVKINFGGYKAFDDIEISDMVLKYPNGEVIRIPWNSNNTPDYDNSEEFLPALYEEDTDAEKYKYTINPGECITGYYSVSNFQHHISN